MDVFQRTWEEQQAVYDACSNMMQWLQEEYDVKPKDTYLRMSADPAFRVRVYQMVRASTLQHVVGAEYPKNRLFPFQPAEDEVSKPV